MVHSVGNSLYCRASCNAYKYAHGSIVRVSSFRSHKQFVKIGVPIQ